MSEEKETAKRVQIDAGFNPFVVAPVVGPLNPFREYSSDELLYIYGQKCAMSTKPFLVKNVGRRMI